jgi:hypothetical protein
VAEDPEGCARYRMPRSVLTNQGRQIALVHRASLPTGHTTAGTAARPAALSRLVQSRQGTPRQAELVGRQGHACLASTIHSSTATS